jgi:hypothetical protein
VSDALVEEAELWAFVAETGVDDAATVEDAVTDCPGGPETGTDDPEFAEFASLAHPSSTPPRIEAKMRPVLRLCTERKVIVCLLNDLFGFVRMITAKPTTSRAKARLYGHIKGTVR